MKLLSDTLDLNLAPRSVKPRTRGITMVIDISEGVRALNDTMEGWGPYIDVAKISAINLATPESVFKRKIDVYKKHEVLVQPGGIIFEIARLKRQENKVLKKLRDLGFDLIEVSHTGMTSLEDDLKLIKACRDLGFIVYGEAGKKFPYGDITRVSDRILDVNTTIETMKTFLEAGASKVYWEGHLLRRVLGEAPEEILKRQEGIKQVRQVVNAIGQDNIVFEVSPYRPFLARRALQFWLWSQFGPEVNIGNVREEEISIVEAIRRGNFPVFGFGEAGDYSWMKSLEDGGGRASPTWWKEIQLSPSPP